MNGQTTAVATRPNEAVRTMDVNMVEHQVKLIQQVMRGVMLKGTHYATLPKTAKPTLLKAGAEKLLLTFRLAPDYVIERETHEDEFIAYTIKCSLKHIVTHEEWGAALGSCNSKEFKYQKKSPWDIDNTLLKMASKRALVAAILNATAASDIFTQDLEDDPSAGGSGGQDKDTGKDAGNGSGKVVGKGDRQDTGKGQSSGDVDYGALVGKAETADDLRALSARIEGAEMAPVKKKALLELVKSKLTTDGGVIDAEIVDAEYSEPPDTNTHAGLLSAYLVAGVSPELLAARLGAESIRDFDDKQWAQARTFYSQIERDGVESVFARSLRKEVAIISAKKQIEGAGSHGQLVQVWAELKPQMIELGGNAHDRVLETVEQKGKEFSNDTTVATTGAI